MSECEHNFIFLRTTSLRTMTTGGTWETPRYGNGNAVESLYDIYYCSKCLVYRRVRLEREGWNLLEKLVSTDANA